jgi:hypothetical protein
VETEARGHGEGRGREGGKEIGRSGGWCAPVGQGFNSGPKGKRRFDSTAFSESPHHAET